MFEVYMCLSAPYLLREFCTVKFFSRENIYAGSIGPLGNGILLEAFNFLTITANPCLLSSHLHLITLQAG